MTSQRLRKKYSDDELEKALAAVRSGKTITHVSKVTGIPRTTLLYKYNGKLPIGKNVGPAPVLTNNEEAELVKWMMYCCQRGFPVTKSRLITNVQLLIKKLARDTPFKDGRPGRHWYESFLRRHPQITSRISQNLTHSRASITETVLREWFAEVEQHLDKLQLINIDKSRVFNCDESAFFLSPKGERVLVKKGRKTVYTFTRNGDKECLTVLFMANANGQLPPPMVVFPYERIPFSISQSMPDGWAIGKSDSGWMTGETFFEYIVNVFHPWLLRNEISMPIILYVDGHCSHLTMPLAQFCGENGIELVALYPNATHLLQPLDVAFFHPLKTAWKKMVQEWRTENYGKRIRNEDFGPLLERSIITLNIPEIMANGFRACGLFPFSADALQYNKLLTKQNISNINNDNMPSEEERRKHLEFFEKYIDAEILKTFTEAKKKEIWDGKLENEGLFNFWLSLQDLPKVSTNMPSYIENVSTSATNDAGERNNENNDNTIQVISENSSNFDATFNALIDVELEQLSTVVCDDITNCDENLVITLELTNPEVSSESISTIQENSSTTFQEPISLNQNESQTMNQDDIPPDVPETFKSDIPPDVPETFKSALFWPKLQTNEAKKRRLKDKIPSVATSKQWHEYHLSKAAEKNKRRIEIEKRKKKRQEIVMAKKKKQEEERLKKIVEKEEKIKKREEAKLKQTLEKEEKL